MKQKRDEIANLHERVVVCLKRKRKKKKRERRKERDTREREREKEARLQDLLSFKGGNVVGGGVGSEGWTRRNIEDQGRTKSFERSGINLHGLR